MSLAPCRSSVPGAPLRRAPTVAAGWIPDQMPDQIRRKDRPRRRKQISRIWSDRDSFSWLCSTTRDRLKTRGSSTQSRRAARLRRETSVRVGLSACRRGSHVAKKATSMHQAAGEIQDSSEKTLRRARRLFIPCDQHRWNDRSTCGGACPLGQRSHGRTSRSANKGSHALRKTAFSYDRGRRSLRQAAVRRNPWPTIGSDVYRYQGLQQSERRCHGSTHEADGTRNHRLEEPSITINHRCEIRPIAKVRTNRNPDPHRCEFGGWWRRARRGGTIRVLHDWGWRTARRWRSEDRHRYINSPCNRFCRAGTGRLRRRRTSGRPRVSHLCYQYWRHSECKSDHGGNNNKKSHGTLPYLHEFVVIGCHGARILLWLAHIVSGQAFPLEAGSAT